MDRPAQRRSKAQEILDGASGAERFVVHVPGQSQPPKFNSWLTDRNLLRYYEEAKAKSTYKSHIPGEASREEVSTKQGAAGRNASKAA